MIELSNGHKFEFMTASGVTAFNGNGWPWELPFVWSKVIDFSYFTNVLKTLTLKPLAGNLRYYNPFGCIRFLKNGVVNAVGLTNPGIYYWSKEIAPKIDFENDLIASIYGEPEEIIEMCQILNDCDFKALEINSSFPNVGEKYYKNTSKTLRSCEAAKQTTRFPIILKLSVKQDIETITHCAENIIEAYTINSAPWQHVYPDLASPLEHLGGGGVSGKAAQRVNWEFAKKLINLTHLPVIVPVWDYEDIEKVYNFGAKAYSFGSRFMLTPWLPTRYVKKYLKEVKENG